jgi:LDH2 family malate/lactate/ureidoglycolate dehydrogenase
LLLHRVNTYEELEEEIERLRAWLREVRARLDTTKSRPTRLPGDEDFEALARDLRAGINAALGDRRVGAELASAAKGRAR